MATDTSYTARLKNLVKQRYRSAYAGSGTLAARFEDLRSCKFADSSVIVRQPSVTATAAVMRCWKRDEL
jgi:hypothetical protein